MKELDCLNDVKICKSFKFLSAGLDKLANKMLKEKDLSVTQGIVLVWLEESKTGALPIKTIEKRFGTAQSTTLGVVNRLEQKHLVTSHVNEQHIKIVTLTDAGRALVPSAKDCFVQADSSVFEGFTLGERALFVELLQKAEKNLLQKHGVDMGGYYE